MAGRLSGRRQDQWKTTELNDETVTEPPHQGTAPDVPKNKSREPGWEEGEKTGRRAKTQENPRTPYPQAVKGASSPADPPPPPQTGSPPTGPGQWKGQQ